MLGIFSLADFFKLNLKEYRTIGVLNSLDLDQAQHFVVPDLHQNCL